jgi:hypothetical protein
MKRLAGIAAIAVAVMAGMAWSQVNTVVSSDEMSRNRTEKLTATDLASLSSTGGQCEQLQAPIDRPADAELPVSVTSGAGPMTSYPSASLTMTLPARWLNAIRIGAGTGT